nr:phytase [Lysobacter arseniciresistens]
MLTDAGVAYETVTEAFITARTPDDNVDSPALWRAADGRTLLLATAKATGRLMAYDGDTGASLAPVGRPGVGAGGFDRPNGIFVVDDLVFVVERDNHRVQVLRLPEMEPLGQFGAGELRQPYGIWLHATAPGEYDVRVTDAYMAGVDARGDDIVPPLADLDERVRRYRVRIDGDTVRATPAGTEGDTTAAGAIRIPESIWGDTTHGRLLVAEEDTATGTALREYRLDGHYAGRTIGEGLFKAQAEGIALWQCDDGSGYWLATDQFKDRSLFHVFDRESLAHLGAFAGATTANTDGVWLHQPGTSNFPAGVFYAVHDDMAVAAFDWRDIARALDLRTGCTAVARG